MRVVIVGAGEVGFNTAQMLSKEGHDVTVLEKDAALASRASEQLDALVMQGNGASPQLLREASIRKSHMLIAATNSDEVNIIACLAAKSQGVRQTVARLHGQEYYDPNDPHSREMLGIDFVIHTEQMAAEEIKQALLVPGAVNVETFANESIEVAEVILEDSSPAVGKAVRDVQLPENSLIVGIVRGGSALMPQGDTVLEARDRVFLIGEQRNVGRVVQAIATDTKPVREVMIFGGGRIGFRLAQELERTGIMVKIVERDEERARYIASRLKKALVLNDDGTSREFLLQERVDRADAFVAATADDRANLLAALYARQLGARLTVAGISRAEFSPLANALGIDITISPRLLAASAILRFVRRGEVVAVTLLESGAEMIELRVPEGCRVAGKALAEAGFPKGALVGAILRGKQVIIPSGRERLLPGDDAVVFTLESAVEQVEHLFAA